MKLPVEAPAPVVMVNVEVAVVPAGGVMGVGSANETSDGADPTHEPDNATAELKPFSDVTTMIDVELDPCMTEVVGADAAIEKSAITLLAVVEVLVVLLLVVLVVVAATT